MQYYLVALFNDKSYKEIEPIQEYLSKKYNLYKNLPKLHITLEVIEDPDMKKLDKALKEMLQSYKKFNVELKDAICFGEPYKSVNLKVNNNGFLKDLSRILNKELKDKGFKVINNPDTWDLHVSLANKNFAEREWREDEYEAACSKIKTSGFHNIAEIDNIELWAPINDESKMVLLKYPLK